MHMTLMQAACSNCWGAPNVKDGWWVGNGQGYSTHSFHCKKTTYASNINAVAQGGNLSVSSSVVPNGATVHVPSLKRRQPCCLNAVKSCPRHLGYIFQ